MSNQLAKAVERDSTQCAQPACRLKHERSQWFSSSHMLGTAGGYCNDNIALEEPAVR